MNSRITTVSPRLNHEDVCDRPFGRDRGNGPKTVQTRVVVAKTPPGGTIVEAPGEISVSASPFASRRPRSSWRRRAPPTG